MALELAEAFLQAGELSDALDALDQHLQQQPQDDDARRLRVEILLRLPEDRAREALADLDALLTRTPRDLLLRAKACDLLGDRDAAYAAAAQAWEQGYEERPQVLETMLRLLLEKRDADSGLHLLADLPKTREWLEWRGKFYALKGDYRGAAEHFCSAIDSLGGAGDPLIAVQRAALLLRRADTYRRLKRWADAEADYRAAEAIIPDDPLIPFNRGLLIFEQGNLRGALPLCRDALDNAPAGLRDTMRDAITTDPRYKTLAQALLL
jgi:tetratricopeptide (TPR) repeat protein